MRSRAAVPRGPARIQTAGVAAASRKFQAKCGRAGRCRPQPSKDSDGRRGRGPCGGSWAKCCRA
eukprot:8391507-Lingulodinium_polyedra.AAC.1